MDQPSSFKRDTPAPIVLKDPGNRVERLRRHSPVSGVRAPRRSYGYAVVALPLDPGLWRRNATRPGSSAAC